MTGWFLKLGCSLLVALAGSTGPVAGQVVPLSNLPIWSTSEQHVTSTGMVWRDCNNDGVIDAFFSNGNDITQSANNIYLFGQGNPPVAASWYSANHEYSGHCAVGDINDDGFADFVVANYLGTGFGYPNRSDLYLNQGGLPETAPSWQTPDEIFSFSCALGDIDGDGDLDIAFATGEAYQNDFQQDLIYLNDGGTFQSTPYWTSAALTAAYDVMWGDVDNDGDLDLAMTFESAATAVFYNQNGTLETTPSWQASTVESGNTLTWGDIDGDGWQDLVVAYNNQLGGGGRFRVYYNDGTGTLVTTYGWQSSTGGYGSALALCDYDNDGDDDLAAGRWFNPLYVYENEGTAFTTAPVWTSGISIVAEELAWVDIDAGGVLDFADTLPADNGRKLFYIVHHPLYAIDSVLVDGTLLSHADFCYDLVPGWVSLASPPLTRIEIYYRYSLYNDLAVSNWDTVNMVFGNTTPPFVSVAASNTFGLAPLAVEFDDNSVGAISRFWDFGDGQTSTAQNPTHSYETPGQYDVAIEVTTVDRVHERTFSDMVSAYADTLWISHAQLAGGRARVDVFAHNYLPITELTIPFSWDGPMNLRYDSLSVGGMRAEHFQDTSIISLVVSWKAATLRLAAGTESPLVPGAGPIASLYFTDLGSTTDSNTVAFANYSIFEFEAVTHAGSYLPVTVDGSIFSKCCEGRVGDANRSGDDEPTIGDVAIIIDMLFISEALVECTAEADVNQSGGPNPVRADITIGDISLLIDYLFITGPTPDGLFDCL